MPPLIWLLRMLLLSFNIVSSFKALKPVLRKRRSSQEPKNLSSADRARRRAIKEQLICWVVFIAFAWGEKLADRTLAWVVPFYSQVKLVLLFFMLAWRSTGSQIIFKKAIKPLVLPYERPVDAVGYILNEVIQLVLAALLFVPRRVGQWWQGKAREPDIPSILVGLRSPHRPPLARTLADSIESAQARSDAEVNKRFSRPIVTSKPEPAPTPVAPKSTLRRPPSTTSLSASTSQRPTAVPFRPIRPTKSREHLSLSASTSRLPRTSNGDASSSRFGASTSVYPSLSASQGPSEVWGTSRASTSRPLVPSSSFKGKQRETFDPVAVPSPPSSSLHGSRQLLNNNSTAPPVPIHLGRSNSAARNSLAIPQPRPPSPPSPQHSPPRDEARAPLVPPTPAPPGSFHASFAAPSPPRLPRPAAVAFEEQKILAGSPRAKASSAIAGLAIELDGGLSGGLAFGSPKKKKKARGATTDVEMGRKRARRGEAEVKPKAAPRKARRRLQDSDEEEEEEEDSEDEYVEEKPEIQKATSPKKRKAPARELQEETSATETEDRVASSSRKLATSTRRTATSAIKPAAASSSRVARKTSIPLTATRSRLSHSTRVAPDSIPTSAPTTDDDGDSHRPATLPKKSARTGASSSTVVAPTRKARRVLGRAGQQEAEQETEVDGVPVVRRRTARR